MQRQRGLTLLELLVVLAIIAISSAGVALAMRDNSQTQLERESQRLIAKLEAARVQSRAQGLPLVWHATASGFVIETPVAGSGFVAQSENWLSADMSIGISAGMKTITLGPEPIIPPATITLSKTSGQTSGAKPINLRIGTDGLQPFHRLP
jgi:general secretion pathway protein H